MQLKPILQNPDWNFHLAPTVIINGDGQWKLVIVKIEDYGKEYKEGSDLDLTDVKKFAFELATDGNFCMTNPVGVLKEDS